jgi:hydrogenase maturation protease
VETQSVTGPTLVSGVGYHDLRDFSVGPWLVRTLREESWPDDVVVEDHGYNPVAVVHRLQEEEPPFRRWVVAGAVRRGRRPGTVVGYRWDRRLPDEEEIQARVAEAVTGVVGLDNLLIVTTAFEAAPELVAVVEVEPEVEEVGHEFSPRVRGGAEEARRRVRDVALGRTDPSSLPVAPLGGFGSGNGGPDGAPTDRNVS